MRFWSSGLGQMCLSALCFSLMGLMMKELRLTLSTSEVVFFRSLLSVIFTLCVGRWTLARVLGNRRALLLVRGLCGYLGLQLYVYALGVIPYAEAAALLYTSPIFTAVFAAWFLRERMPRIGWIALGVSLCGSLLILRPEFGGAWIGGLCALGAGIISGVAYTTVRALAKTEENLTIVLYFAMVSLPIAGVAMLPDFVWPDLMGWVLVIGMGFFAQLGQVFLTRALRAQQAGVVTTGVFFSLVLASFWGWLFFGEVLSNSVIFGIALIIASILLLTRFGRQG